MKAKEYAKRYIEAEDKRMELVDIAYEFIAELKTIADERNARKDGALLAIVKEQEQKWHAFCKRCEDPNVRIDGFAALLKEVNPSFYEALKLVAAQTGCRMRMFSLSR